jgi:hypothetical protein
LDCCAMFMGSITFQTYTQCCNLPRTFSASCVYIEAHR